MKWITNIYNPCRPDAERMFRDPSVSKAINKIRWKNWLKWIYNPLREKIIGKPMPSDMYSQNKLEEQGMIGVYEE